MIRVEGYKAFHGVMCIAPVQKDMKPFEVEGDWLYNPDYDCWYGNGSSYPAVICGVVRDDNA